MNQALRLRKLFEFIVPPAVAEHEQLLREESSSRASSTSTAPAR